MCRAVEENVLASMNHERVKGDRQSPDEQSQLEQATPLCSVSRTFSGHHQGYHADMAIRAMYSGLRVSSARAAALTVHANQASA